MMIYKDSELAHKYLDNLIGIEIGGSAHNPFHLNTKNVDFTSDITSFKQNEINTCGCYLPVDIVASGDILPLSSNSVDFVISSHVLEHFTNPIKALMEWYRVIKPQGYIFMIVPHKDRTFDNIRERTSLRHLIEDYQNKTTEPSECLHGHEHVWVTLDIIELIMWMNRKLDFQVKIVDLQDIDDKTHIGFTFVLQKVFYEPF